MANQAFCALLANHAKKRLPYHKLYSLAVEILYVLCGPGMTERYAFHSRMLPVQMGQE